MQPAKGARYKNIRLNPVGTFTMVTGEVVNKSGKCRGKKKRKFSSLYPSVFWVKAQYFPVPTGKLTSPIMNNDLMAQKKNPSKNESYESM